MRVRDVVLAVVVVVLAVLVLGMFPIVGRMAYGGIGFERGFVGPGIVGGFGLWWPLLMMVFWAIIIVGGVALLGRAFVPGPTAAGSGRQDSSDRALDILRERYAKGEITKEQFDQMWSDLSSAKRAGSA